MEFDELCADSTTEDIQKIAYSDFVTFHNTKTDGDMGEDSKGAAKNGWQKQEMAKGAVKFVGRIPLDHDERMNRLGCQNEAAMILEEHPTIVFYDSFTNLPPYFRYEFEATVSTYTTNGRKIAYPVKNSLKWTPLAVNVKMAMHVLTTEFEHNKYSELRRIAMVQLAKMDHTKTLDLSDLTEMVACDPSHALLLRSHPIMKRIFMHERMVLLYPFYPVSTVLHLSIESIISLARYFDPSTPPDRCNPADLCFWHTSRQFVAIDGHRKWFLPELRMNQYKELRKIRKIPPNEVVDLSVEIYHQLIQQAKVQRNKYIDRRSLYYLIGRPKKTSFAAAIDDMLKFVYKAVKTEPAREQLDDGSDMGDLAGVTNDLVYLREIFVSEDMIISSIKKSIENFNEYKPSIMSAARRNYRFIPNYPPCSEQVRMVEWCKNLPLVIISGPGGSGKTDSLCRYVSLLDPEELLLICAQTNNAAGASDRITERSFSAHKLLHEHALTCHESPCKPPQFKKKTDPKKENNMQSFVRKQSESNPINAKNPTAEDNRLNHSKIGIDYDKCILEKIKVLIIDEISLMYDKLFAALVHNLVKCGRLCQIILCGDHRQQAQIQTGQLQKDLMEGFGEYTIIFNHCHRFDDSAASILWHNAQAIHNGRPQDMIYDKKTSIRVDFPRIDIFKQPLEFEKFLEKVYRKYKITDNENTISIARTNAIRKVANQVTQVVHHNTDTKGFVLNQKITYLATNYDLGLTAKEILVLLRIEDCEIPKGSSIRTLKDEDYAKLTVLSADARDTWKERKPRNMARRLVCRVAGKPMEPRFLRIIPFNAHNHSLIVKAGCFTEYAIQGGECHIIVAIKPFFWSEGDVKEACYVVATRPKQKIIWIANRDVMDKWICNPSPSRDSVMGKKLRDLFNDFRDLYPVPVDSPSLIELTEKEGNIYTPVVTVSEKKSKKRKRDPES